MQRPGVRVSGRSGVALPRFPAGSWAAEGAHLCAPVTRGLEAGEGAKDGGRQGGARGAEKGVHAAGVGPPKGVRGAGGSVMSGRVSPSLTWGVL